MRLIVARAGTGRRAILPVRRGGGAVGGGGLAGGVGAGGGGSGGGGGGGGGAAGVVGPLQKGGRGEAGNVGGAAVGGASRGSSFSDRVWRGWGGIESRGACSRGSGSVAGTLPKGGKLRRWIIHKC